MSKQTKRVGTSVGTAACVAIAIIISSIIQITPQAGDSWLEVFALGILIRTNVIIVTIIIIDIAIAKWGGRK